MILIGVFFIIDGIFLYASEKFMHKVKTRQKSNDILGILSITIGIINMIAFILLLTIDSNQPVILTAFWVLLCIILILFGLKLIIKKATNK
jgi:hypothetical protein